MASEIELTQRLSALEHAVTDLQRRVGDPQANDNWLANVRGSFRGDAIFAKMIEYGREIRKADRPNDDSGDE